MKKIAILFFVSIVLFAGCKKQSSPSAGRTASAAMVNSAGFPIVDEPITMTVFGSRDPNQAKWSEMFFFKKYAEMTNIRLELQEVPSQGFEERKNLLFASNNLPDIFIRAGINPVQFAMYGVTSKQLIPLEPYLDQWAPNIAKIIRENETVRMAITASDGHVYVLPALNFSNSGSIGLKQWINKRWLAKLGLGIPSTPEEFKQVLIAFRDRDPNGNGKADEIPLGIREISSIYLLAGSWGLEHQLETTANVVNGKVHFWLKDNAFKEYLQFLNELYREKLLWQNYYKADSRPEWRSNLSNALFGIFYMPYSDVFSNVEDQFIGFPPIKGPYGDQIWADVNNGVTAVGAFAVSNAC
jgi:putative aldouronate transport system substrate-binding protein